MVKTKGTYFFLRGDFVFSVVCNCFTGVTRPASTNGLDLLGVTGTCICWAGKKRVNF